MPLDGTLWNEDARLLLKAAGLVQTRGLAKHIREDDQGRVCLHGALSIAVNSGDIDCQHVWLRVLVCDHLRSQGLNKNDGVEDDDWAVLWNNAPERTAEDVIQALEGAAARVMAEAAA